MIEYKLFETNKFNKQFRMLPKNIQNNFKKQFKKIKFNPFACGKPIFYSWFREIKQKNYRVYYLIYETKISILFVGISDKKTQQKVIDFIKDNIDKFKKSTDN